MNFAQTLCVLFEAQRVCSTKKVGAEPALRSLLHDSLGQVVAVVLTPVFKNASWNLLEAQPMQVSQVWAVRIGGVGGGWRLGTCPKKSLKHSCRGGRDSLVPR